MRGTNWYDMLKVAREPRVGSCANFKFTRHAFQPEYIESAKVVQGGSCNVGVISVSARSRQGCGSSEAFDRFPFFVWREIGC